MEVKSQLRRLESRNFRCMINKLIVFLRQYDFNILGMKKLVFGLVLFLSLSATGQVFGSDLQNQNTFQEKDNDNVNNKQFEDLNTENADPPGPPGGDLPIDDYIPLLMVLGLSIATYVVSKGQKLKNNTK